MKARNQLGIEEISAKTIKCKKEEELSAVLEKGRNEVQPLIGEIN